MSTHFITIITRINDTQAEYVVDYPTEEMALREYDKLAQWYRNSTGAQFIVKGRLYGMDVSLPFNRSDVIAIGFSGEN